MRIDWKKLSIILLVTAAIILCAFFIYYFFFRPIFTPAPPADNANQAGVNGQLPIGVNGNRQPINGGVNGALPGAGNINGQTGSTIPTPPETAAETTEANLLTDQTTLFTAGGANGDMVFYNPEDGKFYRINADGQAVALSSKVFHDVSNVVWSNGREKAILEYPDGSKIVFNFSDNRQITLPKHWEDFSFAPTDQQIAYKSIGLDPENRFLTVAKADGSQAKTLEALGNKSNQFLVDWSPNNQMVASFIEGKDVSRSNVYFIGLNKENFPLMTINGRGFRPKWSPKGDVILYSVYESDNYRPQLWLSSAAPDSIGNNRLPLGLETWGDKCAFASSAKIYCAVPQSLPNGAGLEPSVADNIPDVTYEIDLATGGKKIIATPAGEHTISQIITAGSANYLFFTDKNNNKTYKINLK